MSSSLLDSGNTGADLDDGGPIGNGDDDGLFGDMNLDGVTDLPVLHLYYLSEEDMSHWEEEDDLAMRHTKARWVPATRPVNPGTLAVLIHHKSSHTSHPILFKVSYFFFNFSTNPILATKRTQSLFWFQVSRMKHNII